MRPRQIKMANDKMIIIHTMALARRSLMRQLRRVAVISIHNLSITLWLAIYDLSLSLPYKYIYWTVCTRGESLWCARLLKRCCCARGKSSKKHVIHASCCYSLQHRNKCTQLQPTVVQCFPSNRFCLHAPQSHYRRRLPTQNKRKSFQLKI